MKISDLYSDPLWYRSSVISFHSFVINLNIWWEYLSATYLQLDKNLTLTQLDQTFLTLKRSLSLHRTSYITLEVSKNFKDFLHSFSLSWWNRGGLTSTRSPGESFLTTRLYLSLPQPDVREHCDLEDLIKPEKLWRLLLLRNSPVLTSTDD